MTDLDPILQKIQKLPSQKLPELEAYLDYLLWQAGKTEPPSQPIWNFDFIDHFAQANRYPTKENSGAEIKIDLATCGGLERPAIYAHPPVEGHSTIEYYVPVPEDLRKLVLKLSIGIRDGSKLAGQNLVSFSLYLNGYRIWGTQTKNRTWQDYELALDLQPGDIHRLELKTQALGGHQWTWAVWGEPQLLGLPS